MPSQRRDNIGRPLSNLFVYGTLRRGSKIKIARLLHANSEFLGPARMQGRLARSHPHRGVVPSNRPGDWLDGEVFRLTDPGKLFPILDEYEGSEYQRTPVTVQLGSGERLASWVYLFRGK